MGAGAVMTGSLHDYARLPGARRLHPPGNTSSLARLAAGHASLLGTRRAARAAVRGRPPRIGAEIASTDETYEAVMDGQGICLLAAGNTPLIALDGVITRPVRGLSPSQLALAWRKGDRRPLIHDYARACQQAV
jgi:DNA-binding transcriptional LysR family regulator